MKWFQSRSQKKIDDFLDFFLQPIATRPRERKYVEILQIASKVYGLAPDSPQQGKGSPRSMIARSLQKQQKKGKRACLTRSRIMEGQYRFFAQAGDCLTNEMREQINAWFLELVNFVSNQQSTDHLFNCWQRHCGKPSGPDPAWEGEMSGKSSPAAEDSGGPLSGDSGDCHSNTAQADVVSQASTETNPPSNAMMMTNNSSEIPESTPSSAGEPPHAGHPADKITSEEVQADVVTEGVAEALKEDLSSESDSADTTPAPAPVEIAEPQDYEFDEEGLREIERNHSESLNVWNDETGVLETLNSFEQFLNQAEFPGLLFDRFRDGDPTRKAFVVDPDPDEQEIWFLGDIHSDLLALEAVLAFLKRRPNPVAIVLLGDLFDDGPHGVETVLRIMRLILENPSRVTLVAGNHDEALSYSEQRDEFHASVIPKEFCEWLNQQKNNELAKKTGKLIIDLIARAPRALFFKDGLLAAHAGVPLSDTWNSLTEPADLNQPLCLQDFVWTRPHHRRKRTIPNRSTKGAGLGYEDFYGFCELTQNLLGFPVRWMVRGHDHVESMKRFHSFQAYLFRPILTINTLCYRLYRENFGPYVHAPCIAKYVPGKLPEIHCIRIPDQLIKKVYPEDRAGEIASD